MEEPPKKPGRRPTDPALKKRSYSLALTPAAIADLEARAAEAGQSPSVYVAEKLKLGKKGKG